MAGSIANDSNQLVYCIVYCMGSSVFSRAVGEWKYSPQVQCPAILHSHPLNDIFILYLPLNDIFIAYFSNNYNWSIHFSHFSPSLSNTVIWGCFPVDWVFYSTSITTVKFCNPEWNKCKCIQSNTWMVQGYTVLVNHITTVYVCKSPFGHYCWSELWNRTSAASEEGSVWMKARAMLQFHPGKQSRDQLSENRYSFSRFFFRVHCKWFQPTSVLHCAFLPWLLQIYCACMVALLLCFYVKLHRVWYCGIFNGNIP